jgi:hypothetical protein
MKFTRNEILVIRAAKGLFGEPGFEIAEKIMRKGVGQVYGNVISKISFLGGILFKSRNWTDVEWSNCVGNLWSKAKAESFGDELREYENVVKLLFSEVANLPVRTDSTEFFSLDITDDEQAMIDKVLER